MIPVWRPITTGDGSPTLLHPVHGEACHSTAGAWSEACERFVAGCRIPERFARLPGAELRVLDVGTGLGLNLAALLRAADAARGRVRVTTLEVSPDVIRRAGDLCDELDALGEGEGPALLARRWLGPVHRALRKSLSEGPSAGAGPWVPLGARGALRLVLGDARRTLPELPAGQVFDAVFLDPFSPAVDPALWEPHFLAEVARRMAAGSWLSTYSAATRVRAALRSAGLRVGAGERVGAKAEGTLASPDADPPPLRPRVARRIERRAREL